MGREELKKAMLLIKEECNRNYNCDSCMFKQLIGVNCMAREPHQWTFIKEKEICYCDRCGKELKEDTAYVIYIGAIGLAKGFGGLSAEAAAENILNNTQPPKYLCKECKDEIKKLINDSTVKEVDENVD